MIFTTPHRIQHMFKLVVFLTTHGIQQISLWFLQLLVEFSTGRSVCGFYNSSWNSTYQKVVFTTPNAIQQISTGYVVISNSHGTEQIRKWFLQLLMELNKFCVSALHLLKRCICVASVYPEIMILSLKRYYLCVSMYDIHKELCVSSHNDCRVSRPKTCCVSREQKLHIRSIQEQEGVICIH